MGYGRDPWAVPRRDRWQSWAAEQAGTNREPTVIGSLLALAVIALLALALLSGPSANAESGHRAQFTSPSCVELQRLQRVGTTHDRNYRATRAACSRSRSEGTP